MQDLGYALKIKTKYFELTLQKNMAAWSYKKKNHKKIAAYRRSI